MTNWADETIRLDSRAAAILRAAQMLLAAGVALWLALIVFSTDLRSNSAILLGGGLADSLRHNAAPLLGVKPIWGGYSTAFNLHGAAWVVAIIGGLLLLRRWMEQATLSRKGAGVICVAFLLWSIGPLTNSARHAPDFINGEDAESILGRGPLDSSHVIPMVNERKFALAQHLVKTGRAKSVQSLAPLNLLRDPRVASLAARRLTQIEAAVGAPVIAPEDAAEARRLNAHWNAVEMMRPFLRYFMNALLLLAAGLWALHAMIVRRLKRIQKVIGAIEGLRFQHWPSS